MQLQVEQLEDRWVPSAGALDPTFGAGGMVTTDFPGSPADYGEGGVVIQNDGKIVVAGRSTPTFDSDMNQFALARYNADGSLDAGFGSGGTVTTDVGGNGYTEGLALQADGKIVVAGYRYPNPTNYGSADFALVRYNADGSLDAGFGAGGKVFTTFASSSLSIAHGVALQADGKIVVAGYSGGAWALARYQANGALDTSFDGDGKLTTDFGQLGDRAYGVAVQADGKIVAAGYAGTRAKGSDIALARYNSNGSLDKSFNKSGKVTTDFAGRGDTANGVVIQADGKIVAAGLASITDTDRAFALARYNSNGTLDTGFDGDGRVTTNFNSGGERAYGVALQADGKIVAAGSAQMPGTITDFALARYNSNGSPDTSFDTDGRVTTDFAGGGDGAFGVAVQADGKIVAAGDALSPDTSYNFAVVRYLPSSPQIGSFTASPNPVTAGSPVTLAAFDVQALNPGSTIAQVALYLDSNGDAILHPATDTLLGYGTQTSDGEWTFSFDTTGLASGTYTLFAHALDSYRVLSDPLALTLEVIE